MPGRLPPALLPLGAVAAFLVIGSLDSVDFAQETVAGLAQGAIFGNLALAIVLVYRASGLINIAQGELATATTYIAYQLIRWGTGYWPAFLLALLAGFVFSAATQVLLIRPVQHRSRTAAITVTVGLFSLVDGLVAWRWGAEIKFVPAPFGNAVYHLGGVAFSRQTLGTLLVSLLSVLLIWLFFRFTKLGLGMRALTVDGGAAELMGVPVNGLLALGWGLAGVLGAVAGLMAEPSQYLEPSMMLPVLVYAFAAAVLGGFESPLGAVIGGLALGVFLNLGGAYVGFLTPALRLPAAFAALVAVLLVRPSGLFGVEQARRA